MKYIKTYEEQNKGSEVVYTFKAKAYSGKHVYDVHILNSDRYKNDIKKNGSNLDETDGHSYDNLIISIANTPGSWFIATYLHHSPDDNRDEIGVQGDWICTNGREIKRELKDWLRTEFPYWKETHKYNV
jgi:hypothetical protein